MAVVMDMSSYLIEPEPGSEYSEEILCAGWNPALDMACQQASCVAPKRQAAMSVDLAAMDAEAFLLNIYTCQR